MWQIQTWTGILPCTSRSAKKVTSQAMRKQEHIKKGCCKGSSSSHGVDESEDDTVIIFEGDVWEDISDSGNVPSHVEDD